MKTTIKILVIGLILATSFTACKKDDKGVTVASAYDYIPLKVGNYWAFEIKEVDSTGNQISQYPADTFRVTKDTLMRGKTFYWLAGSSLSFYKFPNNWFADSAGYLINQDGLRFFSATNFNDTIRKDDDTPQTVVVYITNYKMEKNNQSLTTPAGSFQVVNALGKTYIDEGGGKRSTKSVNNYFAKNVGFVSSSIFWLDSKNDVIANLTGYKLL